MKLKNIIELEEEIEYYHKNLRKVNIEKEIDDLINLLYAKLSDEDVRILEISINRAVLNQTNEIIKTIDEFIKTNIGYEGVQTANFERLKTKIKGK